jgi:hypothetical protein
MIIFKHTDKTESLPNLILGFLKTEFVEKFFLSINLLISTNPVEFRILKGISPGG